MRKIRLSPIQNLILRLLEEAGEETSKTLEVTLAEEGYPDKESYLQALEGLKRLGFVEVGETPVQMTSAGYQALTR